MEENNTATENITPEEVEEKAKIETLLSALPKREVTRNEITMPLTGTTVSRGDNKGTAYPTFNINHPKVTFDEVVNWVKFIGTKKVAASLQAINDRECQAAMFQFAAITDDQDNIIRIDWEKLHTLITEGRCRSASVNDMDEEVKKLTKEFAYLTKNKLTVNGQLDQDVLERITDISSEIESLNDNIATRSRKGKNKKK